jgi:hypothetical protein
MTTTLNRIRQHKPWLFRDGWKILATLNHGQPQDDPLPFSEIVDKLGLKAALWCCRTAPEYANDWCLFCVWCYRSVQHLEYFGNGVEKYINIALLYVNGNAPKKELQRYWGDRDGRVDFSLIISGDITRTFAGATGCFEGEAAKKALKRAQKEEFLRIVNRL